VFAPLMVRTGTASPLAIRENTRLELLPVSTISSLFTVSTTMSRTWPMPELGPSMSVRVGDTLPFALSGKTRIAFPKKSAT
jgi:hypothetical protein